MTRQEGVVTMNRTWGTTQAGGSPFRTNFDDYRDSSGGIKVPFVVNLDPAGPRILLWPQATLRVTAIQDNVAIDNSRFAKPASSTPTAR